MSTRRLFVQVHQRLKKMDAAKQQIGGQKSVHVSKRKAYDREELEHFKAILLAMREEALNDLRNLQDSVKSSEGNEQINESHDFGSSFMERSLDATTREQNAFLMNRQSKLLGYLDAALKRIGEGRYGICLTCKGLIEKERLEILPHTQLCIACKSGGVMRQQRIGQ